MHLLSAVQAIERALVGVHVSFPVIYEIHTGNADGGKVSLNVAAGVDCLDMVLEYTSGNILNFCYSSLVFLKLGYYDFIFDGLS